MKVLVADDDAVSRRLIESALGRWGFEAVVASDGLEASHILHRPDAPKLAVLDWMMPGLEGIELCRELRIAESDSYTYILLVTGKHNKSDVIRGLDAGADDYITKPFDPRELRVRLNNGKRILSLLDQVKAARETLRELAAHDPLTGLWNHGSITDLLINELDRAKRQGVYVGVVLVDLDHFKSINDTHGHLVGDQVLRETANTMSCTIRPYDAVGRLGGEEFLVVLPGCDQINTISHAERLRLALHQIAVKSSSGPVHITASFGVAVVGPESRIDARTAIHNADSAMYAAKRAGRDRVEISTSCLEPV